jgi:glutamyl/glutaminyl-tRNA synthetase
MMPCFRIHRKTFSHGPSSVLSAFVLPQSANPSSGYRGRLAPSPTGFLHLGHARTFWIAQERARSQRGALVLRNEDLDRDRCKPEYVSAMIEDLLWFGLRWEEGPDCGGPFGPYCQSERQALYQAAFVRLREGGFIYPCYCSRRDVQRALRAPHQGDDEPLYPGTCRPLPSWKAQTSQAERRGTSPIIASDPSTGFRVNWRFRVPDGEMVTFGDGHLGPQTFVAGRDFGDFVVWRHDAVPSYQLAVTVDDAAMKITEVVRGADLLVSTARQLLLYRALGWAAPAFYHAALLSDARGVRLAKRHDSFGLRTLRNQGATPETVRASQSFRVD